jgi:hypothetical protein
MKLFICLLLAAATLTECPRDNKRRVKSHRKHAVAKKSVTPASTVPEKHAGVISGNESGILVSASWLKNYQALEAKHGTIAEDAKIYTEGARYRIPSEVAAHFNDMVRADSPPSP